MSKLNSQDKEKERRKKISTKDTIMVATILGLLWILKLECNYNREISNQCNELIEKCKAQLDTNFKYGDSLKSMIKFADQYQKDLNCYQDTVNELREEKDNKLFGTFNFLIKNGSWKKIELDPEILIMISNAENYDDFLRRFFNWCNNQKKDTTEISRVLNEYKSNAESCTKGWKSDELLQYYRKWYKDNKEEDGYGVLGISQERYAQIKTEVYGRNSKPDSQRKGNQDKGKTKNKNATQKK